MSVSTSRATRLRIIRAGSMSAVRNAAGAPSARPTPSTRFLNRRGTFCASVRPATAMLSTARRSRIGCRSTSISAVSSTPCCICFIRAFLPGRSAAAAISISMSRSPGSLPRAWSVIRPIAAPPANGCSQEVERDDSGRLIGPYCCSNDTAPTEKMSKSKKNVVGLDAIVDTYGADTARLYLLSDSPPERDLEWTETGIEGAWRYVNRLWRMVSEPAVALPPPGAVVTGELAPEVDMLRRVMHRTVAAVGDDLDKFRFNRAVARIRELTNAIEEVPPAVLGTGAGPAVLREALETVTLLVGPMMPHLAEEMWQVLGREGLVAEQAWPVADPELARQEQVTIAVQVNGKLRGTLECPRDAEQSMVETAALQLPQVLRWLEGRPPRKVIVVPNRIVSIVA